MITVSAPPLPNATIVSKKFENDRYYLVCRAVLPPDLKGEPMYNGLSFDEIPVQVGGYGFDDHEEGEMVTIMETPATSEEVLKGCDHIKWVQSPQSLTINDFLLLSKEARTMIQN